MSTIRSNLALIESGEALTDVEKRVVAVVKAACNAFLPKEITARFVGGWVRDKLLGKESDDIDVSVEGTDGLTFANKMSECAEKSDFPDSVVVANPAQSAHIGSAKVYLTPELSIDVCGLRKDSYSDSRIPITSVGTPFDDAERRDFTVNSLFYNLNTSTVEDFCGGVDDLERNILRTCIPCAGSFLDDPLRILRLFRFGARFGFNLADGVIKAANNARDEYEQKVSPERANQEILKSLEGPNPAQFVRWTSEAGLFDQFFDPLKMWGLDGAAAADRVESAVKNCYDERLGVALAAIFQPLVDREPVKDIVKKNNTVPAIEFAVQREMKFHVEQSSFVAKLCHGGALVKKIMNEGKISRLNAGHFVMETGPLWQSVHRVLFDPKELSFFMTELKPFITEQKLETAYKVKPILRGKQLADAHGIKPGPGMAALVKKLIDWQLENPEGTAEDYIASISK